jgi:hypothetical protein
MVTWPNTLNWSPTLISIGGATTQAACGLTEIERALLIKVITVLTAPLAAPAINAIKISRRPSS